MLEELKQELMRIEEHREELIEAIEKEEREQARKVNKVYIVSREHVDWDEWESCVVIAPNEELAQQYASHLGGYFMSKDVTVKEIDFADTGVAHAAYKNG